jgi:hypothetical protein
MQTPLRVPLTSIEPPHQPTQPTQDPARPGWLLPSLAIAALGLALGAVLLGRSVLGRAPCDDLARPTQQVRDFLAKGNPSLATGMAESALEQRVPPPCPAAKQALALLWYRASLDVLLASPTSDAGVARQVSLRWLTIEQKADGYGLDRAERVASIEVARRAYAVRAWPLADTALRRAFEEGTPDAEAAGLRYGVLRNWAGDLAFRTSPPDRAQAIQLLATAQAIAAAYRLPHGEACLDLQQLGIADCSQPAPDQADPALVARTR